MVSREINSDIVMTDKLTDRLRLMCMCGEQGHGRPCETCQAADALDAKDAEIERLKNESKTALAFEIDLIGAQYKLNDANAEIERLKKALQPVIDAARTYLSVTYEWAAPEFKPAQQFGLILQEALDKHDNQ